MGTKIGSGKQGKPRNFLRRRKFEGESTASCLWPNHFPHYSLGTRHRGPARRPPDSMAEEGDGTSSSKKRRIESLEKRIKGGVGLMGLSALSARTTKKQQPTHQHRRRPDKVEGGGAGPGGAGFGSNGGRGFGSGGGGGAKRAGGPADAKPERSDPSRLRFRADASTSRGSDANVGPDAAWYAPVGSRTRAGVMSSAHARAFPRNLLPGDDDGTSGGDAAVPSDDANLRRAWIRQHLRDLVATNPKAGADAEAVITSKTKDKALLLDSANGAFSVDEVRAARARRLARSGRDARLVGAAQRRRRCGLAVVPVDKARWETFLPLHELWRAYVAGLLEGCGSSGGRTEERDLKEAKRRLASAELVGAAVTVSACKRPSLCGTRGIVARDTSRCVVLVTRGDESVTVPKKGARFEVEAEAPGERVGGDRGGGVGGKVESRIVRVSLDGDSLVRS